MIKSRQVIESYADCKAQHAGWTDQAVEDYQALKDDINRLLKALNNGDLSPQSGTGSPEGVVTANYSLLYVDTSVPTLYFNSTFGENTGWVAL